MEKVEKVYTSVLMPTDYTQIFNIQWCVFVCGMCVCVKGSSDKQECEGVTRSGNHISEIISNDLTLDMHRGISDFHHPATSSHLCLNTHTHTQTNALIQT